MKRIIVIITFILSCAALFAQGFKPTTTWPYLYPQFIEGTAKLFVGGEKNAKFNITLAGNKLHYIDGNMVLEAKSSDISAVQIGTDIYQNVSGEFYKVLARSEKSLVILGKEVDYAALNGTGGAYGSSSSTLGTMALTSAEGIGGSNSNKSLNHMELLNNKDKGKILPLTEKLYIFYKGYKIFATRRDVLEAAKNPSEVKTFIKENKIKWKDPNSLLLLGDFLSDSK